MTGLSVLSTRTLHTRFGPEPHRPDKACCARLGRMPAPLTARTTAATEQVMAKRCMEWFPFPGCRTHCGGSRAVRSRSQSDIVCRRSAPTTILVWSNQVTQAEGVVHCSCGESKYTLT